MKENREEYQNEKEKREKRLLAYADMIQSAVQQDSSEVIRQLVEERKSIVAQLSRQKSKIFIMN